MKLITAIKMTKEREKQKLKNKKEIQKNEIIKMIRVSSVFPQDDIIALKVKTREASVSRAISKAVSFYLRFADEDRS